MSPVFLLEKSMYDFAPAAMRLRSILMETFNSLYC